MCSVLEVFESGLDISEENGTTIRWRLGVSSEYTIKDGYSVGLHVEVGERELSRRVVRQRGSSEGMEKAMVKILAVDSLP